MCSDSRISPHLLLVIISPLFWTSDKHKYFVTEIGCPDLAAELEQPADAAEQLCKKCKKDPKRNCKECGCTVCGSREDAGKQLFCEECEFSK